MAKREKQEQGRFAYEGLERVIHEKARLGIMTCLSSQPGGLVFNDLKSLCNLTDGNLSRHLSVLAEESLVEVWKGGSQGRPSTMYRLTAKGRERFLAYLSELERVVSDAAAAAKKAGAGRVSPA